MSRVLFTPTGTVSDAGLLQTAITNAGSGGRVDIVQGRALINAAVMINMPVSICGVGPSSVLARAPGFTGSLFELRSAHKAVLSDFTIDDAPSADAAGALVNIAALFAWNCNDSVFENIQIRNGFRTGISIAESDGVVINKCVVEDMHATAPTSAPGQPWAGGTGGHGMQIFSRRDKPYVRNVRITNCTLRRNWRTGVIVNRATQVVVEGCSFVDNMPKPSFDAGVECGGQLAAWTGCYDVSFIGNTILGGYDTQGIEIDITELDNLPPNGAKTNNIIVSGNTIREQGRTGLLLFGDIHALLPDRVARVVITGNIIEDCTQRDNDWYGGITVVEGISDFVMSANCVLERKQAAVRFRGQNRRWVFVGNHLEVQSAAAQKRENVFAVGPMSTGAVGVCSYICNGIEV